MESSAESHSADLAALEKRFQGAPHHKVAMLVDALYFEDQSLTQPLFFPK
ncbi:MAG: hypothetical protein ACJ8G3_07710 [Burkholderiaceae bacterium]